MSSQITVIVTSSDRFDLLCRTLDSFLALNTYPIHKYVLNEDSGNRETTARIIKRYGHLFHVLHHPGREGLSKALDNLMLHVDTQYVFNIEDDWMFRGNANFIQESVEILEGRQDVHQVWIRDKRDHKHPVVTEHPMYDRVTKGYMGIWHGFSFNPSLRRTADIRRMFPNGFSEFGDEVICNRHAHELGYNAVSLTKSAIRHIGWGRHTENFKA